MPNGDGFGAVQRGIKAADDLKMRAFNLAQKEQEVAQQKIKSSSMKVDRLMQLTSSILSQSKGPMRDLMKKQAQLEVGQMQVPIPESYWDMIEDDSIKVPLSQSIAGLMGLSDPEHKAALLDPIIQFSQNPIGAATELTKLAATFQQQRAATAAKEGDKAGDEIGKMLDKFRSAKITNRSNLIEESLARITAVAQDPEKVDPDLALELKRFGLNTSQLNKKEGQGFSDIALIFNFMKMLDPGSVVRESEFRVAATTGGVAQRAAVLMNKVLKGDRLEDGQRKEILQTAQAMAAAQRSRQKKFNMSLFNEARARNIPLDRLSVGMGIELPKELKKFNNVKQILMQKHGFTEAQANEMIRRRAKEIIQAQGKLKKKGAKRGTAK